MSGFHDALLQASGRLPGQGAGKGVGQKQQIALVYRYLDARVAGCCERLQKQACGYQHFDCDRCSAADLCVYRELTVLLRGEDLLGIEREWRDSLGWLRSLPLCGRRLNVCVLQGSALLEPDLANLLEGLADSGADVSIQLLASD